MRTMTATLSSTSTRLETLPSKELNVLLLNPSLSTHNINDFLVDQKNDIVHRIEV
jgi:hypothetical protein